MAQAELAVKTAYWLQNKDDSEYGDRSEVLTIMRAEEETVIEFAISPDAHPRLVDTFYIRVPAGELMAALTAVLMGKNPHPDDEP